MINSLSYSEGRLSAGGNDNPLAPTQQFVLDYEKSTGAVTLEPVQKKDKEDVRITYVPGYKWKNFIKKHTSIRKALKKNAAYKKYLKDWEDRSLPF